MLYVKHYFSRIFIRINGVSGETRFFLLVIDLSIDNIQVTQNDYVKTAEDEYQKESQ